MRFLSGIKNIFVRKRDSPIEVENDFSVERIERNDSLLNSGKTSRYVLFFVDF